MENQQQEVETCSKPTSDPEERKKHIVTITVSHLLMCIVWVASRALCQLCIREGKGRAEQGGIRWHSQVQALFTIMIMGSII